MESFVIAPQLRGSGCGRWRCCAEGNGVPVCNGGRSSKEGTAFSFVICGDICTACRVRSVHSDIDPPILLFNNAVYILLFN